MSDPQSESSGYTPPGRIPIKAWDKTVLEKHCQTAVLLELHTIPMYLFPMYAVKEDDDQNGAVSTIRGIVLEEMLHMALAGNLSCALGFQPILYGVDYTPTYPRGIFYEKTMMNLWPPNHAAMTSFVKIERPLPVPKHPQGPPLAADYPTIGEFYNDLMAGLKRLAGGSPELFDPSTENRQFSYGEDHVYPTPDLHAITDLSSAKKALTLIKEQGEGAESVDGGQHKPSHWTKFKNLEKIYADNGSIPHYATIENPNTSAITGDIQKAMLASDAAYCYLLLTIEKSWAPGYDRKKLVANVTPLMRDVMAPIAKWLVTQKLDGSEKHAAPPFNYFPFDLKKSVLNQLVDAIQAAVNSYPNAEGLTNALDEAKQLSDIPILDA
ncbi:hypothetical protein FRC12_005843 [Ceratobasidium sp. 428]|nr:hypothetical protein FRC12_005843 [Ceratobasidium sp. 428]